mgnify:CR=1 FL=1
MRRNQGRRFRGWLLLVLVAGCLTACSALKPKLDPVGGQSKAPPRKVVLPSVNYQGVFCYLHNVRWPEETLAVIARWYTGKEQNARILARVTPNLRANDLRKGDVVFIPRELFRHNVPLTHSYARKHGKTPASAPRPATQTAAPPDDDFPEDGTRPVPYGPRTYPD